jgi:DASH complex subunit DAD1
LNRKLEEVLGLGKEFGTIANLWGKFHALAREQPSGLETEADGGGIPGTGGHVSSRKSMAPK